MEQKKLARQKTETLAEILHNDDDANLRSSRFEEVPINISSHPQSLRLLVPRKVWIEPVPPEGGVRTIFHMRMNRTISMNLTYPVIAWEFDSDEESGDGADGTNSPRTCLEDFLELADATDEAVLSFVGKWGVLDFCKWATEQVLEGCGTNDRQTEISRLQDNLHLNLDLVPTYTFAEAERDKRLIQYWQNEHREEEIVVRVFMEPVEAYRIYAREAAAMIRVAACLFNNGKGSDADWKQIVTGDNPLLSRVMDQNGTLFCGLPSPPASLADELSDAISQERYWLAEVVNDWLGRANIQLAFFWGKLPHVELGLSQNDDYSRVLSVSCKNRLVLQLMTTLCSRFHWCRYCNDGKGKWHPYDHKVSKKRKGAICESKTCKSDALCERVRKCRASKKATEASVAK